VFFFFLVQTNMTSIAKKIKVQSHPPDTRSLVYVQVVTIGRGWVGWLNWIFQRVKACCTAGEPKETHRLLYELNWLKQKCAMNSIDRHGWLFKRPFVHKMEARDCLIILRLPPLKVLHVGWDLGVRQKSTECTSYFETVSEARGDSQTVTTTRRVLNFSLF
jgi:hypothetical protein